MTTNDPVLPTIRTAIVGASGYAGAELLAILSAHPHAQVVGLFGSSRKADEGAPTAADLFPRFESLPIGALKVEPFSVDAARALDLDAIFLATPHELAVVLQDGTVRPLGGLGGGPLAPWRAACIATTVAGMLDIRVPLVVGDDKKTVRSITVPGDLADEVAISPSTDPKQD